MDLRASTTAMTEVLPFSMIGSIETKVRIFLGLFYFLGVSPNRPSLPGDAQF